MIARQSPRTFLEPLFLGQLCSSIPEEVQLATILLIGARTHQPLCIDNPRTLTDRSTLVLMLPNSSASTCKLDGYRPEICLSLFGSVPLTLQRLLPYLRLAMVFTMSGLSLP
jgi:hypothetical protein